MKGTIGAKTIVKLVVIIAAFLILLPIISKVIKASMLYSKGGLCLVTAAGTSLGASGNCIPKDLSTYNFRCYRRHVSITPKKTVVLDRGFYETANVNDVGKVTKNYDSLTSEIAESVMAEELIKCWERFGEGEVELFRQAQPSRFWQAMPFGAKRSTGCFLCSEISFDNLEDDEQKKLKEADFDKYLYENNIIGKEKKYTDELNNPRMVCEKKFWKDDACWSALDDYFGEITGGKTRSIDPDKKYYAVFVRKRFDICQDDDNKDGDFSNFAYVFSEDKLSKVCSKILV